MILFKNDTDKVKFINNKRVNPGFMLVEENGKQILKKIEKKTNKILINNSVEKDTIIKEINEPIMPLLVDKEEEDSLELLEEIPKKKKKKSKKKKTSKVLVD